MIEWKIMYCVENRGQLKAGQQYQVKKINKYTAMVKCRGLVIYEDTIFFQMNPPIIKVRDEDDYEDSY